MRRAILVFHHLNRKAAIMQRIIPVAIAFFLVGCASTMAPPSPEKIEMVSTHYDAFKAELLAQGYKINKDDFNQKLYFWHIDTHEIKNEESSDPAEHWQTFVSCGGNLKSVSLDYRFKKKIIEVDAMGSPTGKTKGWDKNWRKTGDMKLTFLNSVRARLSMSECDRDDIFDCDNPDAMKASGSGR